MSGTRFVYRRRVDFGDCDSARVYFTPRALDYAVEAVEAWYEDVLGVSWADLVILDNLEVTFVQMGCEYFRPVIADQTVHVRVRVTGIDQCSVTFSASGEDNSGEPFFRATLVAQFSERRNRAPIPIPARYRESIEACVASSDGFALPGGCTPEKILGGVAGRDERNPRRLRPETTAGKVPYTSRRRVVYGDCTLSGTVYAPRLFNYAVEAAGEWYRDTLGISWLQQCSRQRGIPFLEIRCQSLICLVPGQEITLSVRISRLGRSSIEYEVVAYDNAGEPCFDMQMAACYISEETGSYRVIPFPDDMRGRILAYQTACDSGDQIIS